MPIIRTGWNIPWKTCGKTTTGIGRKCQEELLVAARCNRMDTIRGTGDVWRRTAEMASVAG